MNNSPIKKRVNPFDTPIHPVQEEKKVVIEEPKVEEIQEVKEETEKVEKKPVKKTQKKLDYTDKDREKYTATMLISLRRKIKVYCATKGVMFSEFIEEACLEKLKKEGE